jgi:hypothetical protein
MRKSMAPSVEVAEKSLTEAKIARPNGNGMG